MKKTASYIVISLTLLFMGCLGKVNNCTSDAPKELIDNFKSYQTIKNFEKHFLIKTDSIIVFEDSSLPETDTRPEFSIYTLLLPEYQIENISGKLKVSFFNDRLMSVWFYPNDIKKFEDYLRNTHNITLENKKSITISCVEISRQIDAEGNEYFKWSDLKLTQEQNDWIAQYA